MAVLAKASALVAAIFGGLSVGFLSYLGGLAGQARAPRPMRSPRAPRWSAALALTAAALYLERCCRAPDPPEDPDER